MKTKGFTLIELLAVVTILALLSAIIIPKVSKSLNESEAKVNLESAKGLVKSAEYKAVNNEIKGITQAIDINYETGENTGILNYSGAKPEIGRVSINSNGEVAMAVKIGKNCYLKRFNSQDITVTPYDRETCNENSDVFINNTMP